jgi:hypothetical protein
MKAKYDDERHKKLRDYMREYLRLHPDKNRARVKKWRENNPEKYKQQMREYRNGNRNEISKYGKEWRGLHPERDHIGNREKYYSGMKRWKKEHPEIEAMHHAVRNMITRSNLKKTSKSRQYIGCSSGFLRGWLEAQFKEGMTWENYGKVWVVDHIVPLKWWDVANFPEHIMEASHYSNLQPMFKRDNIIKGARFAG